MRDLRHSQQEQPREDLREHRQDAVRGPLGVPALPQTAREVHAAGGLDPDPGHRRPPSTGGGWKGRNTGWSAAPKSAAGGNPNIQLRGSSTELGEKQAKEKTV